jgi:hypothetical protein
MDLVRGFRRGARWTASLAAALALGLLALGIPSLSGVASAVAPGTFNTAEFDVPSGLAFGGGHLWVTNEAGNSVTEIDPSTGASAIRPRSPATVRTSSWPTRRAR